MENLIVPLFWLSLLCLLSYLCRVLVLGAVDVLGADVVFVHVAHHLPPLGLGQTDAQRTERVKDDLSIGHQ